MTDAALEYNDTGVEYHRKGMYDEAVNQFDFASKASPTEAGYLYNKGISLAKLRNFADAVHEFDLAISLRPKISQLHHARAAALIELGRVPDAIRELEAATEYSPKERVYHYRLGLILGRSRDYRKSAEEFQAAMELGNDNHNWLRMMHHEKGKALNNLGLFTEALAEYERCRFYDFEESRKMVVTPDVQASIDIASRNKVGRDTPEVESFPLPFTFNHLLLMCLFGYRIKAEAERSAVSGESWIQLGFRQMLGIHDSSRTSPQGIFYYEPGSTIELTAESDNDFHFLRWTCDSNLIEISDPANASTSVLLKGSGEIRSIWKEGWQPPTRV